MSCPHHLVVWLLMALQCSDLPSVVSTCPVALVEIHVCLHRLEKEERERIVETHHHPTVAYLVVLSQSCRL